MIQVSDRILNINEPETLAMARLARELQAQGHDVVNLSLGEPDFDTPDFIKKAAIKAMDENFTKYPPVAGFLDLKEAICYKFKRDNHLDYKPENIVVSTGAKQSIANICLSILNPGDEVLLPAPYWVTYREIVKLCGAIPVMIPSFVENGFKITPSDLRRHISPKTKLMIYSSPSNPTGSFYSFEELKRLVQVLEDSPQIMILSDEIYEHINFEQKHVSIASFASLFERVVVVNGVSKAFAMTGWRIGYMAGPKWLADACSNMQGQFTSGPNTIAQKATIAALLEHPMVVKPMVDEFHKRRDLMVSLLQKNQQIKLVSPQGAFYVFPDVSYYYGKKNGEVVIQNSKDLSMYLLYEAFVSTVPGEAFDAPNNIRLSFATSRNQIEKAVERIFKALEKLK
jgi:aspartate aminotransferase